MKKIKYNCDEVIYNEVLPNGLNVYLYPTNKTKNFYITVSTHFGAEVLKYKKNDKVYDVTLGSAHFLEHRVMDFTKNKETMEKINELGSIVNAYTTYNGTNYNIFGNENIIENMKLLFDRVFYANIKKEDVEAERGIILEEYNMYFDDPYFIMHNNLDKNLFNNSYIKYPVLGSKDGIMNVSDVELNRLYKDFYVPKNMFIVVTGNFDLDTVMDFIRDYNKDIKSSHDIPKVLKPKEKPNVAVDYEEVNLDVNEEKVAVGYKIPIPKGFDKYKFRVMFYILISNLFSSSGDAYEELINNGIKRSGYGMEKVDNYVFLYFKASTSKVNQFLEIIDKYLKNISISTSDLERKKRGSLSSFILSFEDLVQVEDNITTEIFLHNKLLNKKDEVIKSITVNDMKSLIKNLDFSNKSVVKICK